MKEGRAVYMTFGRGLLVGLCFSVTTPRSEERGFAVLTGRLPPPEAAASPSPQAPSEPRKNLDAVSAGQRNASGSATGVRLEFYPSDYPMEPPTPSFKVHGERCPQGDFSTHRPPTMLYAMSASGERGGVHESPSPCRGEARTGGL